MTNFFSKYKDYIILTLFSVGIISFIIYISISETNKKNYVHHAECVNPQSGYSVDHGYNYINAEQVPINITNLVDAITYCNSHPTCQKFTYNERKLDYKMKIVNDLLDSNISFKNKNIHTYTNNNIIKKYYSTDSPNTKDRYTPTIISKTTSPATNTSTTTASTTSSGITTSTGTTSSSGTTTSTGTTTSSSSYGY